MANFSDEFDKTTKELGIGTENGAWFKPKEGANKLRILTSPIHSLSRFKYGICYEGAPYCKPESLGKDEKLQNKWLVWAIDRSDGAVKLYNMPYSITKEIATLQSNEEYVFESFPMPYDITLSAKGAGTKEVEYTVLASRKNTPLTDTEIEILDKQTPPEAILESMKDKVRAQHGHDDEYSHQDVEQAAEDISTLSVVDAAYQDAPDPSDIPF